MFRRALFVCAVAYLIVVAYRCGVEGVVLL